MNNTDDAQTYSPSGPIPPLTLQLSLSWPLIGSPGGKANQPLPSNTKIATQHHCCYSEDMCLQSQYLTPARLYISHKAAAACTEYKTACCTTPAKACIETSCILITLPSLRTPQVLSPADSQHANCMLIINTDPAGPCLFNTHTTCTFLKYLTHHMQIAYLPASHTPHSPCVTFYGCLPCPVSRAVASSVGMTNTIVCPRTLAPGTLVGGVLVEATPGFRCRALRPKPWVPTKLGPFP